LPCLPAAGHTNTQIARQLGISEGTVRTHLENIYQKLGVSSRTAAVTRAFPDRTLQDPHQGEPICRASSEGISPETRLLDWAAFRRSRATV
jgi:predicted ArsR family transcriptional regulator